VREDVGILIGFAAAFLGHAVLLRRNNTKAALASNTWALRAHARAQHRANPNSAVAREEGFELTL
jgi:hypothetical protein